MPRFVLLYHDCPPGYKRPPHWDLMFEVGSVLRTWALARLPQDWQLGTSSRIAPGNVVDAEVLGDHRLEYLEYDGSISGERGHVTRVDAGTYQTVSESSECWDIALAGKALRGRIVLCRTANPDEQWTLTADCRD